MAFLSQVHIYCFLMSYLASLGCEGLQLLRRQSTVTRALLLVFTAAGFLAHTAYLIVRSRTIGLPPLLTSQQDWLLVLAWLGSLLYLVLLITQGRLAHGLFMLPVIVLLVVVAIFVSDQAIGNLREVSLRRWGMFHASSLVLGIGAVVGAALSGLMYLLHHQRLRSRSGWLQKLTLPNLEDLTSLNRWMVVCSVPCLTIGLITGFLLILWRQSPVAAESVRWSDPTIVATVFVWIAMIVLLFRLLVSPNQTGKSVAQLSLLSGGFLLITILGPMLMAGSGHLNTFHSRPQSRSEIRDPKSEIPGPESESGNRRSETSSGDPR